MSAGRVSQDIPFAMVPRWVIQALGLDMSALAVYTALAVYASSERRAFPGIRTLASDLGCSPTTVQAALKRLERSGAIVISRRFVGGRPRSNLYRLVAKPLEAARLAANHLGPVDNPVDKSLGAWI